MLFRSANAGIGGTLRRGSYGSLSINGSTNSYSGLDMYDQSMTWMCSTANGVSFGVYKTNSTWAFYFDNSGILQVGTVPGANVSGNISGNAATATTATTATTANATNTSNNFQMNSLGVGTAGSGTAGEIRATNNVTAYYSSDIKFKENVRDIPDEIGRAHV